jgi:hypothetical protein
LYSNVKQKQDIILSTHTHAHAHIHTDMCTDTRTRLFIRCYTVVNSCEVFKQHLIVQKLSGSFNTVVNDGIKLSQLVHSKQTQTFLPFDLHTYNYQTKITCSWLISQVNAPCTVVTLEKYALEEVDVETDGADPAPGAWHELLDVRGLLSTFLLAAAGGGSSATELEKTFCELFAVTAHTLIS